MDTLKSLEDYQAEAEKLLAPYLSTPLVPIRLEILTMLLGLSLHTAYLQGLNEGFRKGILQALRRYTDKRVAS